MILWQTCADANIFVSTGIRNDSIWLAASASLKLLCFYNRPVVMQTNWWVSATTASDWQLVHLCYCYVVVYNRPVMMQTYWWVSATTASDWRPVHLCLDFTLWNYYDFMTDLWWCKHIGEYPQRQHLIGSWCIFVIIMFYIRDLCWCKHIGEYPQRQHLIGGRCIFVHEPGKKRRKKKHGFKELTVGDVKKIHSSDFQCWH
jgi:hypothetical protein